jgi:hypothetical protein
LPRNFFVFSSWPLWSNDKEKVRKAMASPPNRRI